MIRSSLIQQIIEYARQRPFEWVNGGVYELLAMTVWEREEGGHFKASNASRRLRELEEEGILQVRRNEKNNVEYRYVPMMQRIAQEEPKESSFSREESKQTALI